MKSILDSSFRYRSSVHTDLKKTFARIRRQQKNAARAEAIGRREETSNVLRMRSAVRAAK